MIAPGEAGAPSSGLSPAGGEGSPDLLEVSGVSFRHGGRTVLAELSFRLCAGERVGLLGPNGAGKTTLLRLLAGLREPAAGRVVFGGRPLSGRSVAERAREIALVPQEAPLDRSITAAELVLTGLAPIAGSWSDGGARGRERAREALADVGILPLAGRQLHTLSGGELRRALIARALVRGPKLLLMDEPLAGLDLGAQGKLLSIARDAARRGAAVLFALHDVNLALRELPRAILLVSGRIVADGSPAEVLDLARVEQAFGPARADAGGSAFFPRVEG